jgi:hypothetical protein
MSTRFSLSTIPGVNLETVVQITYTREAGVYEYGLVQTASEFEIATPWKRQAISSINYCLKVAEKNRSKVFYFLS